MQHDCITGKNSYGEYHPSPLKDKSRNELSCFAHDDVHAVLAEHKLKSRVEFLLTCVENGKKRSSKLQVSIIGKEAQSEPTSDNLEEVIIPSMRDAGEILAAVPDLGFRAKDARPIGLSLFIART